MLYDDLESIDFNKVCMAIYPEIKGDRKLTGVVNAASARQYLASKLHSCNFVYDTNEKTYTICDVLLSLGFIRMNQNKGYYTLIPKRQIKIPKRSSHE